MAVENWIDEIAKLFEISDGRKGTVKSYRAYEKADFPEAITVYPCAITYTTGVKMDYPMDISTDIWNGATEFHLVPGVGKHHYPYIMLYFAKIKAAARANKNLSGKVALFILDHENISIQGPAVMTYGSEDLHLGLVVRWVVTELEG